MYLFPYNIFNLLIIHYTKFSFCSVVYTINNKFIRLGNIQPFDDMPDF